MTQNEWVLNALKKGPVTPIQALSEGGIFRLAARIQELRESGHEITTHKVEVTRIQELRESGHEITTHKVEVNGKSFAQYVLEGKQNAKSSPSHRPFG